MNKYNNKSEYKILLVVAIIAFICFATWQKGEGYGRKMYYSILHNK